MLACIPRLRDVPRAFLSLARCSIANALYPLVSPTARTLRRELDAVYVHANRLCAERDAVLAELADRERELAEHTETVAWVARELEAYQRREHEGRS